MRKKFILSSVVFFLFITNLLANQGGSDGLGYYMWTDSETPNDTVKYEWIDIRDGTPLFLSPEDDSVVTAQLPFSFVFYGANYSQGSQLYISTNGFVSFTNLSGNSYPANATIPTAALPNNIIAAYWDNLEAPTAEPNVYAKTVGSSPNRKFIIMWDFFTEVLSGERITFEIILFEHSNLIKIQYNTATAGATGSSATVGIENSTGGFGSLYSINGTPGINQLSAILFHPQSIGNSVKAAISPDTVLAGTNFQQFVYRFFDIDPADVTGMGRLDRIAISNPIGNNATVTSVKINNYSAPLQNNQNPPSEPGFATWFYNSVPLVDSIVVQTSAFDVIDSLIINFAQNIPTTTSPTNNFNSNYDAKLASPSPQNSTSAGWNVAVVGTSVSYYDFSPPGPQNPDAGVGILYTVTARDIYGNAVNNSDNVVFSAQGSATATFSPSSIRNFSGTSQVTVTVTDNTAGTFTVLAEKQGSPGINGQSDLITVDPAGADHFVILPGVENPVTVGSERLVQVALEDNFNNRIPGASVIFTRFRGTGIFNDTGTSTVTKNTNISGVAEALYTASQQTSFIDDSIRVNSGTLYDSLGIPLQANVVSYYLFDPPGPRPMTVGDSLQYEIIAKDQYGNPKFNADQLNLEAVGSTTAGFSPGPYTFGGDTSLTFKVSDNTPGSFKVKAAKSDDIFIVGESGTITTSSATPDTLLAASTTDTTITVGNNLSLSVTLEDAFGNGLSGQSIIFERTQGSGVFTDNGLSSITKTTSSIGKASANYRVSQSTAPGSDIVRVRYSGGGLNFVFFTMNLQPESISYYTINPQGGSFIYQAGTNIILNINAYDVYNNLATNSTRQVTLVDTATGLTVLSSNPVNLTGGTANFTVRNTVKQSGLIFTVEDAFGKSANSSAFTINPDDLDSLAIYSGPNRSGISMSGVDSTLTIDSTLILYAAGFDQFGNYINDMSTAGWTTTGTLAPSLNNFPGSSLSYKPTASGRTGTIQVVDRFDVLVTGDATGTITVNQGAGAEIRITLTPGGAELGDRTFVAGEMLTLYASLFDAGDSYLGTVSGDWTISPSTLGEFQNSSSTITAATVQFTAKQVGSGNIRLDYTALTDFSGLLTVNAGPSSVIVIRDQANGGGVPYDSKTVDMTTDSSITLYAAHYDSEGNFRKDSSVTWAAINLSGDGLTPLPGGPASQIAFSPAGVGSGRIRTSSATLTNDTTDVITVSAGQLNSIVIQDGSGLGGSEINTLTLSVGDSADIYASGYDLDNNFLGDKLSNWSLDGESIGTFKSNPAAVNVFRAQGTGNGVIEAVNIPEGLLDRTSSIQVNPGTASLLFKVSESDSQSGPVAQQLPIPIKVRVFDNFSNAVPGVTVTWLPKKGGTASPGTSVTGTDGIAETDWTLHNTTDTDTLAAYLSGTTTTPDTIYYTAFPQPASNLTLETLPPTNFSAAILQQVGPLRVRILDTFLNPAPGVEVSFAVTDKPSGATGESLTAYNAVTNSSGIAQTNLVLGSRLGTYTVRAFANTTPGFVEFTGDATTPGTADSIIIVRGNNQTGVVGQTLSDSVKAKLVDVYLNPVQGLNLVFEPLNGGSVNPSSAVSDANGFVRSRWTLGQTVGTYNLQVRRSDFTVISDTLAADATHGPATNVNLVNIRGIQQNNITALPNASVSFVMKVTDTFGNAVPGVNVSSEIEQGANATVGNTLSTTNSDGEFSNSVIIDGTIDQTIVRSFIAGVDTARANVYRLQYVAGSLTPFSVSIGEDVTFSLNVRNPGPLGVRLQPSQSFIRFSDGINLYQASAITDTIPGSPPNRTLNFNLANVDAGFIPANYQPEIVLRGTGKDNLLVGSIFTNTGDLRVYSVELLAANVESPASKIVGRGGQLIAQLQLRNDGDIRVAINSANTTPVIKKGATPVPATFTKISGVDTIEANTTTTLRYQFDIPTDFDLDSYTLDGQFQGTVVGSGTSVSDNEAGTTDNFTVTSGAAVDYVASSLTPQNVNSGDLASFSLILQNSGDANVFLQTAGTFLAFGNDTFYLDVDQTLPSAGNATLVFENAVVQLSASYTAYTPTLFLDGLENQATFRDTITISDAVSVFSVPQPQVINFNIASSSVSQGQNGVALTFDFVNSSAPPLPKDEIIINSPNNLMLHNKSLDNFNANLLTPIPSQFPISISPGSSRTFTYELNFDDTYSVGTDTFWAEINYIDENTSTARIEEDSVSAAATDNVIVLLKTNLVIQSIQAVGADTVSQGQTGIDIRMSLFNTGQVDAQLDTATINFLNNHTFTSIPAFPIIITGGNGANIDFEVTINPNAALGPDPLNGSINYTNTLSLDTGNENFAATDSIFIQSFNPVLISLNSVTINKSTVNQGQTGIPAQVRVINNGQASIRVDDISLKFAPQNLVQLLNTPTLPFTMTSAQSQLFNFDVTVPDTIPTGLVFVDTKIQYTELNSSSSFADSGAVNIDSMNIQIPANFNVTAVLLDEDSVSAGKTNIGINFQVINDGEAGVQIDGAQPKITPLPNTIVLNRLSPVTLPTLSSGDTTSFVYRADSGDSTGSFDLDFLLTGVDLNDDQVLGPDSSSSPATLLVNKPGDLKIDSVDVTQEVVSVGQNDVPTNVYLRNRGKMPINVNNIFLTFNGGLTGFAQTPLDTLNFELAGGDTITRRFNISILSNAPFGQVIVDAQATGFERNLQKPLSATADVKDTIEVINIGEVFVDSTKVDSLPNLPNANVLQPLVVSTKIINTGQDSLQNVSISLLIGTTVVDDTTISIPADSSVALAFPRPAPATPGNIVYIVRIDSAFSQTTGLPVSVGSPVDDRETIIVQTPAQLQLTVIPQQFILPIGLDTLITVTMANLGQAAFDTGSIEITLPQNYSFKDTSDTTFKTFDGNNPSVTWRINADSLSPGSAFDSIEVKLVDVPIDKNIDSTATLIGPDSIFVEGRVVPSGDVEVDTIRLVRLDSIAIGAISTGQRFILEADVRFIGNIQATGRRARLDFPTGFAEVTPRLQNIDGADALNTVRWEVIAPSSASPEGLLNSLTTASDSQARDGVDRGSLADTRAGDVTNSPDIINAVDKILTVTVWGVEAPTSSTKSDTLDQTVLLQDRARMNLAASITSPTGAQDQRVSTNQYFEIEVNVSNSGEAITSGDNKVEIILPAVGYSLAPDSMVTRDTLLVSEGSPLIDTVYTGNAPIPIVPISLQLVEAARDTNSGSQATGGNSSVVFSNMRLVQQAELQMEFTELPGSISQDFQFRAKARVNRLGEALILPKSPSWGNNVRVKIDYDTLNFDLDSPDSQVKIVPIGQEFSWIFRSIPNPANDSTFNFIASIDSFPLWDENFDYPDTSVFISDTSAIRSIELLNLDKINITNIYLKTNAAGIDSSDVMEVSTRQDSILLHVDALFNPVYSVNRIARIKLPEGYPTIANPERSISSDSADWYFSAPTIATDQFDTVKVIVQASTPSGDQVFDSTRYVLIKARERANLFLSTAIEKEGLTNDSVSYGQQFVFKTTVTNAGKVGIFGPRSLTLQAGNSLQILLNDSTWSTSDTRPFAIGVPVEWTVKADSNSQLGQILSSINRLQNTKKFVVDGERAGETVRSSRSSPLSASNDVELNTLLNQLSTITETSYLAVSYQDIPGDSLTGKEAYVSPSEQLTNIFIQPEASIEVVDIQIPDTISTNQIFIITATVVATPQVGQRTAELTFPSPYNLPQSGFRNFESVKTFNGDTVFWEVTAPKFSTIDRREFISPIKVEVRAKDQNTSLTVSNSLEEQTWLEQEALLAIRSVEITSPPESQGRLAFNQKFTIQATILNRGDAGITGQGIVRLDSLSLGSITLQNPELGYDRFFSGPLVEDPKETSVEWKLTTPGTSITRNLEVTFVPTSLPLDINKETEVALDPEGSVGSVAVSTTDQLLTAQRLPNILPTTGGYITTQGVTNLAMAGFLLKNQETTTFVPTISIDNVTVQVIESENPVVITSPEIFLSRIKVTNTLNPEVFSGINPELKIYADYGLDGNIFNPDSISLAFSEIYDVEPKGISETFNDSLVIWVDIKSNAPNRSFRLRVSDIHAFVNVPEATIRVEDGNQNRFGSAESDVISGVVTAVSSDEEQIFKNYPNPFGSSESLTKFIFWMDGSGSAEIKIYTLLGGLVWSQRVEGLSGGQLYDGLISWDGRNSVGNRVLNGVYIAIINIQSGGSAKSFKTKVAYVK